MDQAAHLLTRAPRCLLAVAHGGALPVTPIGFWFDGANVWAAPRVGTPLADGGAGGCAVWVEPAEEGEPGVAATGRVRVFSARDPAGLALHGPTVAAAAVALGTKYAATVVGYAQDALRLPLQRMLRERVVLRITLDDVRLVQPPALRPGVAPTLPPAVPADVRRMVVGKRRIALATAASPAGPPGLGPPELGPAVWGGGFSLVVPPERELAVGALACATVTAAFSPRPAQFAALALDGTISEGGRLHAEHVVWWHGFATGHADLPTTPSTITLPD